MYVNRRISIYTYHVLNNQKSTELIYRSDWLYSMFRESGSIPSSTQKGAQRATEKERFLKAERRCDENVIKKKKRGFFQARSRSFGSVR